MKRWMMIMIVLFLAVSGKPARVSAAVIDNKSDLTDLTSREFFPENSVIAFSFIIAYNINHLLQFNTLNRYVLKKHDFNRMGE